MSITLYQFPISHYCEKIRWALDYKGLKYKTKNLMPGLHLRTTKKMTDKTYVPILEHNGKLIQDSRVILDYLDEQFPDKSLTPTDSALRKEATEWEALCDIEIGRNVRRYCYHELLQHPKLVIPFFTKDTTWWSPLFFKAFFPKLEPIMRKTMQIDAPGAKKSEQAIEQALDTISERLQNRQYLVGDHFTRADLAAAALLAPLFMPEGYGLDWPEHDKLPDVLLEMQQRNADKLQFAQRLYKEYR